MGRLGRAHAWHLRRLRVVPLALFAAIAIAACGGGGHAKAAAVKLSPAELVSRTFSASDAVSSGRVALTLSLTLDGIKQLDGKPIVLSIAGPFSRGAGGISTDLAATVSAASSTANIAIVKIGHTVDVGLDGTYYSLPVHSSTGAPTGATPQGHSGALGSLGIDPANWLSDPHDVGTKVIGNVLTEHLHADINVAAVLGDVAKMIGGATGASGSASSSSSVLELLESAITQAQVDVYTGVADHIVRELDLNIAFTVPALASGVLGGLSAGSLSLQVTLTQLGQPQTITAPANVQPSSKLLNGVFALESKFGSLASLVGDLTASNGSGSNFGGLFTSSSTSTAAGTAASSKGTATTTSTTASG